MPTDATRYCVVTDAETGGALRDIANERWRQINEEGFTREHDDLHGAGELKWAAAAYQCDPKFWPWEPETFKPGGDKRDLIKAAALIVAELERLARLGNKK